MKTKTVYKFLMFVACLWSMTPNSFCGGRQVFATWDSFEVDKCASIWLIKRFIDPSAMFQFHPKGTHITEGIPFDVPDGNLSRNATKSSFEVLLEHYRLNDPALKKIGQVIHDIEINSWGRKKYKESLKVERDIMDIITRNHSDRDVLLEKAIKYFDQLYKEFDSSGRKTPLQ
ncbi:MAG TPA: hypothetical protein ENG51_16125 [Deltaproteobacteria bacterium]|nr:hypothetical protein [Deltaproteobacteria bacterium]